MEISFRETILSAPDPSTAAELKSSLVHIDGQGSKTVISLER